MRSVNKGTIKVFSPILISVEQLFNKRSICLHCHHYLSKNAKICSNCDINDEKKVANIFDVNQSIVFSRVLNRLSEDIEANRDQTLSSTPLVQLNNDVIFNEVYRKLQHQYRSSKFVSLLLHVDGIGITNSTKLSLWVCSCCFVELPSHLRYRKCNMPILSVWVGYCEPDIDLWLEECFSQFKNLKETGI